ncbi:MAG: hypothetical protein GY855_16150 [candidate division Zixibacteria bacterium]|nr:hypothetical protein [candidate division Zixibacteria bacterium]
MRINYLHIRIILITASLMFYSVNCNAADKKAIDDIEESDPVSEMEEFEIGITSPNWWERIRAARSMADKEGIDKNKVATLIIDQLEKEINSPTSVKRGPGPAYKDISDRMKRQYFLGLADFGQDIKNHLSDEMNLSSGELKKYLILTLGFLKDENVHDDIRELLANHPDVYIRATAAIALRYYWDVNDILLFKEALNDTAWIRNPSDVIFEGKPEFIYPVRREVKVTLRNMGYKVTSDSNSDYTAKKLNEEVE